jgi:hypothetical protein
MTDDSRLIILNNEVEARLLESVLTEKGIPHLIRSYKDLAYDGIYQFQQGWGHVEAPPEYMAQVRQIYDDLCKKK